MRCSSSRCRKTTSSPNPARPNCATPRTCDRPILPVQIGPLDSMRVNPLAAVQAIDYQNPSIDTGMS